MTEPEAQREKDLIEWGQYCRNTADVTFARWQEIKARKPDTGDMTKPGPGRPEHLEENKALKEQALPTDYPSGKIIAAREKDTAAKSAYEARLAEPRPVSEAVTPDPLLRSKQEPITTAEHNATVGRTEDPHSKASVNWPEAKHPIVDTDVKHPTADLDSKGHKRK